WPLSNSPGGRVVVTGAASGIGIETARALAGAGAQVTLAVRDRAAGRRVAQDIVATKGNAQVLVAPLDLTDLASIAAFVAAWDGPLHVLVNKLTNATSSRRSSCVPTAFPTTLISGSTRPS
ncbi:MAG: short-chain dehydrogenase/reductase, partial [Pseudonocardia sp.]|nr:short-chain dehydrogenase/reductase [Pseudonocardia sp.]